MAAETTTPSVEAPTSQAMQRAFTVPFWLQRSSAWAWRLLLLVAAFLTLGWLLLHLRVVVLPVLIATMLASALVPAVSWCVRKGMPRLLATWLVLLVVGSVIGAVLFFAVWGLSTELAGDSGRWQEVGDETRRWLQDGPLDLSSSTIDDIEQRVRDTVVGGASSFGSGRARLVGEIIGGMFLTVAMTFFFVKDGGTMWGWIVDRVHPNRRELSDEVGKAAVSTLASYLKAVAITGVIDAVVIGLGLWLIGVPLIVPLAVITFFGAFLPIIGATAAGAIAAVVALVTGGPTDAILVVVLTLVVQQIEGDVVMPYVMGREVPLHPAVVLASLAAGGAIAGIIGAFVAVPFAAVTTAAISVVREHRTLENA